MSYKEHAKREFLKLGCEDDIDKWIQESVLELLEVFSKQGHSGSSSPYAIHYFEKLANHEPLSPIMCTDDEWSSCSDMGDDDEFQNNRCSAIFKSGIEGRPYYLDAIVWTDQNNNSFKGSVLNSKNEKIFSRQNIKLPFTPKTFYVDVIDVEIGKNDYIHRIKEESQLKEVWKYYEHQETQSYMRLKKSQKINDI
jgi:hypothetical protein